MSGRGRRIDERARKQRPYTWAPKAAAFDKRSSTTGHRPPAGLRDERGRGKQRPYT